jgi:predicted porin
MQKKIIALAVAGAAAGFAAPVFAQSNVTVYGVIDVGVESAKFSDAAGTLTRMITSGNTTNRIGFKGSEDLGNGMKANFMLESQPYPDVGTAGSATAGNSNFWHRTSTVGLSGANWGSVNLGSQYTPWFSARAANDIFYVAGVGSNYTNFERSNTRISNSIRYDSANYNGFTMAAAYGFGQAAGYDTQEGTTAATKKIGQLSGLNLAYANGPMALRYAFEKYQTAQGPDVNNKANTINGSYDFQVVKAVAGWASFKNDGVGGAPATIDEKSWYIGAVMPVFGKDIVKAEYSRLKDNTATAATGSKDAKMISIGYEHPMSKRTTLYATYAKLNNDSGASRTFLSDNAVGVAAGFDPSAFQMGLKHSF